MRRQSCLVGLLVLIAVSVLSAVTWRCVFWARSPNQSCPIESLVVGREAFAPHDYSRADSVGPIEGGIVSQAITLYFEKGVATHAVCQYGSAFVAGRVVRSESRAEFSPGSGGPWTIPVDLDYWSPIADQYYLGCGPESGTYMCKLLAQYEEYYVLLFVHVEPSSDATIREVNQVLWAIDERMAECLGKQLPED